MRVITVGNALLLLNESSTIQTDFKKLHFEYGLFACSRHKLSVKGTKLGVKKWKCSCVGTQRKAEDDSAATTATQTSATGILHQLLFISCGDSKGLLFVGDSPNDCFLKVSLKAVQC